MRIDALLLTRDFLLQRAVERSVQEFGISAEHHASGQKVLQRVAEWKFAAVITDCDHHDGMSLLETTRLEPRNRNTIAIALTQPGLSMAVPFRSGANFVLDKPVTRERVSRLLRAAYSLIAREHFRYLRHALDVPVTVLFPTGLSLQAKSRNVSTRGLGLQSNLLTGWPTCVRVYFKLPDATTAPTSASIQADCEVAWADPSGRAGLKLISLPRASQREFDAWIAGKSDFLSSGLARPRLPNHADIIAQGYPRAACS
jgi:CheY-like chemotaxis protein